MLFLLKWNMLLLIFVNIHSSEQNVLKIAHLAFSGAKFVYELVDTLQRIDSDRKIEVRIEELKKEISQKIDASTTRLFKSILFSSKLDRLEDAVVTVHSSLLDLKLIVENKGPEQSRYQELFKTYYLHHEVTKHIRFLPTLLTYEIPGTAGKLMDLWIENTRCNLTSLHVFKHFYFELITSGMALEATFNYLSVQISANITLEEWEPRIEELEDVFLDYENDCKSRFVELVSEDIGNFKGADKFTEVLDQRYPWKIHDVFFLNPLGTYQFMYYESKDKLFTFKDVQEEKRLVVSIDKVDLNNYNVSDSIDGEMFRPSITSSEDNNAARHVGTSVRKHLNDLGYDVRAVLSFFDLNDTNEERKIVLNEVSPVMSTVVRNVTLKYCHKSGIECIFHEHDEVQGDMKVFFYIKGNLSDSENNSEHVQLGAATGTMFPLYGHVFGWVRHIMGNVVVCFIVCYMLL